MKRRPSIPLDLTEDISIVRNGNFNRLWAAQALSQVAQNLLNFALIIRVFQLAQGTRLATISVAVLVLSFGLPSILFAAAAGLYTDHWNKRTVLFVSNVIRAVLALAYLVVEQNLAAVLLISFLMSTTTQFFTPAEASAIPALVSKRQLLRANSLFVITMYASFVVGYSASAPVISFFGASGPYLVTGGMFALAAVLVALIPSIPATTEQGAQFWRTVRNTGKEVLRNWRIIRHTHGLAFPITQLTVTQSMLNVIMALAPALSLAIVGVPIQNASHYLIIPAGIGMITGVVVIDRLTKWMPRMRLIATGLIVGGASLMLLGLANRLQNSAEGKMLLGQDQIGIMVAPIIFILGLTNAIVLVASQTILQESTTESSRGKIFGALGMMVNLAATVPILVVGALVDLTSVQTVVLAMGAGLFSFALWQYFWLHREGKLDDEPEPQKS